MLRLENENLYPDLSAPSYDASRVPMNSMGPTLTQTVLANDAMSPLFQAVKEATEEAVYNSMFMAKTTKGFQGRTIQSIPVERVLAILKDHKALAGK